MWLNVEESCSDGLKSKLWKYRNRLVKEIILQEEFSVPHVEQFTMYGRVTLKLSSLIKRPAREELEQRLNRRRNLQDDKD